MTQALHGHVAGKVQGVGYRAFASEQARIAGVTGWARNTADGRVEVFLQGSGDAVRRVVAALRSGPPRARVDDVALAPTTIRPGLQAFEAG